MPMKMKVPENAIAPILPSRGERQRLRNRVENIVDETVEIEQAVRDVHVAGRLDPNAWKTVKVREDVRVYRQRGSRRASDPLQEPRNRSKTPKVESCGRKLGKWRSRLSSTLLTSFSARSARCQSDAVARANANAMLSSATTTQWTSEDDEETLVGALKPDRVPMMYALGTQEGSLEDAALGCFAGDNLSSKLRSLLHRDRRTQSFMHDTRELAVLRRPNAEDPFQSMRIAWFSHGLAPSVLGVRSLVRTRDFVVSEATGYRVDSMGEKFAFHVIHSSDVRGVPDLDEYGIVRAQVSLCFIFRQLRDNTVGVFCRGFFDPCGDAVSGVASYCAAEMILAVVDGSECALARKLQFIVPRRRYLRTERLQKLELQEEQDPFAAVGNMGCELCSKTKLPLGVRPATATCEICGCAMCARCSLRKKLSMDHKGDAVVDLTLCLECACEAKQASGKDVAMTMFLREDPQTPKLWTHDFQSVEDLIISQIGDDIEMLTKSARFVPVA